MIAGLIPIGDLDLDRSEGLSKRLTGSEYRKQKIRQRLLFIRGEWFADTRLGMPWFEEILVKNPDLRLVQARIRDCVLSVKGITSCRLAEFSYDAKTRNLAVAYEATDIDGATITDVVSTPVRA